MAVLSMKALLETGVHFGHRTRKWNPLMKQYIFTERNGIHIIDLQQTLEALEIAYALVRDTVEAGGSVLFVGTKRQGQESIQLEAERCGMAYVNSRWLGGTLTNWQTIRSRISELENLERRRDEGEFELLTKKEALTMTRKINRLEERLGGIRNMKGLPQLLFVVDVRREDTAIHEANLLNIPVVALVDTNCDPTIVDYVVPSNDDAIRAIKLLTSKVADAVLEGKALRKDVEEEMLESPGESAEDEGLEKSDEDLLGEATLAKLQTGEYDEKLAGIAAAESAGESVEKDEESAAKDDTAESDEVDETKEAADEEGEEDTTKADEVDESKEAAGEEAEDDTTEADEVDESKEAADEEAEDDATESDEVDESKEAADEEAEDDTTEADEGDETNEAADEEGEDDATEAVEVDESKEAADEEAEEDNTEADEVDETIEATEEESEE